MKKIIFGITSLGLGGAERVLVDLANELSKNNQYQITILTIYGQGELEKQLSSNVEIKNIYPFGYNQANKFKRKLLLPLSILVGKNKIYKKYIKDKYDIEIAFLEGPITRIFSVGKNSNKKIAWIHNDIAQVFGTSFKSKIKRKMDEKIYNKFKNLIFVSQNNVESFEKAYPKNKAKKQVIYNYIDDRQVLRKAEEKAEVEFDKNQTNIVTVARLVSQKALDRLIKVHSKLIKEGISHNIYIIGDGPEKEKLEELIKNEKCEKTVKLLGKRENPYPYVKQATYFCLLSNFEGYGMVLEEAKILNKYILITDTAAKEAIQNYKNSKVFENSEEGIYIGLKEILTKDLQQKKKQDENENATCEIYNNSYLITQVKDLLNGEKT